MKYNTRFNPSISGALHIGHLYMALVNEAEAHRAGGKFIIRVDDMQEQINHWIKKDQRDKYYEEYQEQLSLFMDVDVWDLQSQMLTPVEIIGDNPLLKCLPEFLWASTETIEWRTNTDQRAFQYNLCFVVEKVIWDFWEGVTLLIRGEDLITESQLYEHITSVLRLPTIRQIYLPKLVSITLDDILPEISKSKKSYSLDTQINEFGIDRTLELLKKACLIDPDGEFFADNIKSNPIAKGFKE